MHQFTLHRPNQQVTVIDCGQVINVKLIKSITLENRNQSIFNTCLLQCLQNPRIYIDINNSIVQTLGTASRIILFHSVPLSAISGIQLTTLHSHPFLFNYIHICLDPPFILLASLTTTPTCFLTGTLVDLRCTSSQNISFESLTFYSEYNQLSNFYQMHSLLTHLSASVL